MKQPNVIVVFADQMRAQAAGYAGNPDVKTPVMDRLAAQGFNVVNAVSGCPVCCPYRASLITGQYPQTHGVFLNDLYLRQTGPSIAECFEAAGYDTAYIGKWHLDGHGREAFIPRERRQGFEYWKALECSHSYNESKYYGDTPDLRYWEGYDAHAQTRDAIRHLEMRDRSRPALLFLSWGAPHGPYRTAPAEFLAMYDPARLTLSPSVPADKAAGTRQQLAGYYAHVSALDTALGWLVDALDRLGMAEDTILLFTSDHGDMVGSRGEWDKQRPYDESVRVPFLLRWPRGLGAEGRRVEAPVNAPDIMPTLLGLCGLPIPDTVEGLDFSAHWRGAADPGEGAALLQCLVPCCNWRRSNGGREYRGIRTARHSYVRDLKGPWLLFDNERDPSQMENLAGRPEHAALQAGLEARLARKLEGLGDEFLPGEAYLREWSYELDERECIDRVNGVVVPAGRNYRDW